MALVLFGRYGANPEPFETTFRETLFNTVSLLTGTGYANADYGVWSPFLIVILFLAGLIGGCAGSTSCSVKIFRYQVLAAVMITEMRRVRRPNGVFATRYNGRKLPMEAATSVMAFLMIFLLSICALTLALAWVGLDGLTALSGAASALANIGPGFGAQIGPAGTYQELPDAGESASDPRHAARPARAVDGAGAADAGFFGVVNVEINRTAAP